MNTKNEYNSLMNLFVNLLKENSDNIYSELLVNFIKEQ